MLMSAPFPCQFATGHRKVSKSNSIIGPWRIRGKATVYENPWIEVVDHDVTHPDGSPGQYGVVKFKNIAIGVLPIDSDGQTWLVGQHRFPHDNYSWELPEGGGPAGLNPVESAKRELAEETGLKANSWREFVRFDVSNSVTDEKAICYLAWDLSPGPRAPEASEDLKIKKVKFNELFEMVINGQISDSLTIVMVLSAHAQALRGLLPDPICHHVLDGCAKT